MFTLRLEAQIQEGVAILRRGGLVAFPTDTLYGLGADGLNEAAVERVFEAKGRPYGMPLPLLLADPADLGRVASPVPDLALTLARRFWPGPLTLVLPKAPAVPTVVAGRGWTVGVRLPNHPVPRELARRLGNPITGTSANLSGQPPAATAAEVRRQLGDVIDLIVEGGPAGGGQESTVVDLTGPRPRIVREGAISREALAEACGPAVHF
ncbi:MAG: threonylcarbamoyl-AMP synthase [Chloroflexi bacterium]|nr:threonylcarbamoyl-AMP synthase [Chloroflexota bacterium]